MKIETEELRDIAGAVREQRPDWDVGAILNVLLDYTDRDPSLVREAAMRAAKHPTSRTPLAIGFAQHWTAVRSTPGPFIANPLPECTACGQPVQRHRSGCYTPRCQEPDHLLLMPDICPACREPFVALVFVDDREEARRRAVPPNAAFRAALAEVRARAPEREDREPLASGALLDRPARTPEPEPELVVPPW